ncbi:MAG: type II toxin-antitoxin system RelE/ParE family toxin [bacterium]
MRYCIQVYQNDGKSFFSDWFDDLDPATAARVDRHIRRLETGNFGSAKALSGGLFELRMHFGPGYRVYYGIDGATLIVLLGGGDKHRQSADISAARERWDQYLKVK